MILIRMLKFSVFTVVYILFLFTNKAQASVNGDSILLIRDLPVKNGHIKLFKDIPGSYIDPAPSVEIYTNDSNIYSISNGTVVKIENCNGMNVLIIKNRATYFMYSNFEKTNLSVGSKVKRGEVIALTLDESSIHKLIFLMAKKNKSLDYFDVIQYLKQNSSR